MGRGVCALSSGSIATIRSKAPIGACSTSTTAHDATTHRRVKWLIVGGGIHGVHFGARLLGSTSTKMQDDDLVMIVDPAPTLLEQWKTRTETTGMKYLRSSATFHLDLDKNSLRRFAITGNKQRRSWKRQDVSVATGKALKKRKKPKKRVKTQYSSSSGLFSNDYERPTLDLFNQHCDNVICKYELNEKHIQGRVIDLDPRHDDHVRVHVVQEACCCLGAKQEGVVETYLAEHVVLALGNDDPVYPEWVTSDLLETGRIRHLLDTTTTTSTITPDDPTSSTSNDALLLETDRVRHPLMDTTDATDATDATTITESATTSTSTSKDASHSIAIVGGGITAAHKALQLCTATNKKNTSGSSCTIHLMTRHAEFTEQQFDTHQDWMMDEAAAERSLTSGGSGWTKRLRKWHQTTCYRMRREIISNERIAGTVTAAVHRGENGLRYAIQEEKIHWHPSSEVTDCKEVVSKSNNDETMFQLHLSNGDVVEVHQVLLATGFGKRPPALLEHLKKHLLLPVSEACGYPLVNKALQWGGGERIYVMGALAELEVGPSARNIAGARICAERILKGVTHSNNNNRTSR